jgi:integrase
MKFVSPKITNIHPKGVAMEKTKYMGVYSRESAGKRMKGNKLDICFYVTYRKEGRLIWEKVGWQGEGYSPKLASDIRSERLRMIRHGEELPKEKTKIPRFSEMARSYLEWAKENKARGGRDDSYLYKNHLKGPLANKRLNEITSFDLERLKSNLTKKELSPASVKHCLVLVREIYNKTREWGKYQGTNPVKGVKMPTLNNQRQRFLSYAEADNLLAELKKVSESVHDQALISLHCGLRAGEIFNLRGQDLDFENGLIRIMDPKNKANRTAYMTQAVREMLKARLPENLNDLIFKDRWHGEKIESISKTFQKAVDTLGFNKGVEDPRHRVVFHTLRHTFASWLALEGNLGGNSILTIKELLGHKSLAMTERYSHLIPDMKKQAVLALEQSFDQKRNATNLLAVVQNNP